MSEYICPLCGKKYWNVDSLAECTARDAKAIREKENKLEELKVQKETYNKALASRKKEIEDIVAKLQNKVNEYNTIGKKLVAIDPKTDAHCAFKISFTSDGLDFDTDVIKEAIDSHSLFQLNKLINDFIL